MVITELWRAGTAPARDGIYWATGEARAVEVDGAKLSYFHLGPPLALDESTEVTEIDVCAKAELPDGSGSVVCGDGAHGSEGFFARLDADGELIWIVALRDSNPFLQIGVEERMATFVNNLGNSVTIDLDGLR